MKYPGQAKTSYKQTIVYANRGMSLEEDLNITNDYYRATDEAIIYKKPTPITISKVEYNQSKERIIKEAYFNIPSTTDYNGIYKARYIDFEAKETKGNAFPLRNIHAHQIEHLKRIFKHGGIAFLIVRFTTLNETYFLDINALTDYLKHSQKHSIPHTFFKENGYLIKEKYNPRLDYLKIINDIYFKGDKI